MEKIFDYKSELFLKMKEERYFVFERYIVFRKETSIYAALHFRSGGLNVVDSFEQKYNRLGLKYEFSGDLGKKWIEKIRRKLEFWEKK